MYCFILPLRLFGGGRMQSIFFRPQITIDTVSDLVDFWQKAVRAAKTTITFAVHSTETGRMGLHDFVRVSEAQLPLLGLVNAEMKFLTEEAPDLSREDRFSVSFSRHDSVVTLETYLLAWSQLTQMVPGNAWEWYENARARFGIEPTPMQYLQALAISYLPLRSRKGIHVFVVEAEKEEWTFRNHLIDSHSRVVFENLMQNSIKYGKTNGQLEIRKRGDDLVFEDDGIGMDPQFAARLGKEEFIRENRAEGVDGTGTGWASIGRELGILGWGFDIKTALGQGTTVTVRMNREDIVPYTPYLNRRLGHFFRTHPVTAYDLIGGARIFVGAKPYEGYVFEGSSGQPALGHIDVTRSPLYAAIMNSYILVPPLIIMSLPMPVVQPVQMAF